MEKIMQFHSGIKVQTGNRHITSPAYFSNNNGISDIEDNKSENETLSPIYKKNSQNSTEKNNANFKDIKILNIPKNKYEIDVSEPNSPESISFYRKIRKSYISLGEAKENPLLKNRASPNKNTKFSNQNKCKEEDEDVEIKELSLFKPQNKNIEEKPIQIPPKKDTQTKIKLPVKSENEKTISDDEADKNCNVVYKEKEQSINNHPYRHLIFSPNITESTFKRFIVLTYRGLVYAKKCLKQPSEKFIKSKQVVLKEMKNSKKKTLFLDLDETLVHTCPIKMNPEHVVLVPAENGNKISVGINIRPYCLEFLEKISCLYEIYIFTASTYDYATEIINFIDYDRKYISGILVRENCMETKIGFLIKDLRIVKNRPLKDMIIVDNLAHSFGFQIDNGIPILEFHNDKNDRELKHLCTYLIEACSYDDVREFNKKKLKLNELADLKLEDIELK